MNTTMREGSLMWRCVLPVVVLAMSLAFVLNAAGEFAVAADQKPPKKSQKSSGKGLDNVKTSDVEVKASEGDTATAIRGKPGHSDGTRGHRDTPREDAVQGAGK